MKKLIAFFSIAILVIVACAQSTPTPPAISQDDLLNTAVALVKMTENVAQTQTADAEPTEPQSTSTKPIPTNTQPPTATSTAKATTVPENVFAWNYIATQESAGVNLTVARVLIADKASLNIEFLNTSPDFEEIPVVCMLIFIIENNSGQSINIYADQGTVVVGSEQISLRDFMFSNTFGEELGGEFYPGVRSIGGIWFGLKRTALQDINNMKIFIGGPSVDLRRIGPDFAFDLDLSIHTFVPLPDELK